MQHQTRVAYTKEVGSALPPTSPHASRAEALRDRVRAEKAAHTAAFGAAEPADEAAPASTLPCGKTVPSGASDDGRENVLVPTIRRRGAGTTVSPNA